MTSARRARTAAVTLILAVGGLLVATTATASAVSWPAAVDVSLPGPLSSHVVVATATDGTAVAVWARSNGTNPIIQASVRAPGGTWEAPVDLSAAGRTAAEPAVAIAPDGTPTVVWDRFNGTNTVVQVTTRPRGGVWQTPVDLSVPGGSTTSPHVAIAPDGTTTVTWDRWNGAYQIVQASSRPTGGTWQTPVDLSADGANAFNGALAVAPDGAVTAIWNHLDGISYVAETAIRPAGGSWQPPTVISVTGQNATAPRVAIGADGTAAAVWSRSNGANLIVQAAMRPVGGPWQPPVDLSVSGQDSYDATVAVAPDGTATVAWDRSDGSSFVAQAATRPAGGSWQSPVDLALAGAAATTPSVAFGPDGTAIVVASRSNGTNATAQVSLRAPRGSWQPPVDLSGAGVNAVAPMVTVGKDGTVAAVWMHSEAASSTIQASVVERAFPAPTPPAPPVPNTGPVKGPKTLARPKVAAFTFTGTAGSTYQCRLDKAKAWRACRSPYKLKTKKLKVGKHVLYVRAVLNGVPDPTPSAKKFKVR